MTSSIESRPIKLASRVVSFLLVLYIYLNDYQNNVIIDDSGRAEFKLGRPELLQNYEQFRSGRAEMGPTETSRRQVWFMADLLTISANNLATLSGKQLYFMQQNPVVSDLSQEEQSKLWSESDRVHLLASSWSLRPPLVDGPVAAHSQARVEKRDPLARWLTRFVEKDSRYEIPDFPLDQQPDPSRVTHIDADLRSCTGAIRDQKSCGACYAFSFNALLEWHYCRQTGDSSIHFSEQYILDCGHQARLKGCTEGKLPDVKDFLHFYGVFKEKDYPYKGRQGRCRHERGPIDMSVAQFDRIRVDRAEWERVLEEQPILVEAQLPHDILSYSRGVHPGNNCDERIGHGMLMVGHGRQDGHPYWLLRNSLGKRWGENGYLRLSREAPMRQCFVNGFVGRFKFKQLDEQKFADFYDTLKYSPTVEPKRSALDKSLNPVAKFLESRRK